MSVNRRQYLLRFNLADTLELLFHNPLFERHLRCRRNMLQGATATAFKITALRDGTLIRNFEYRYCFRFVKLLFLFGNLKTDSFRRQCPFNKNRFTADLCYTPAFIIQGGNFRDIYFRLHSQIRLYCTETHIFAQNLTVSGMICQNTIEHTLYFDMNKTICLTAVLSITSFSYAHTVIPDVSPIAQGQHVFINIPQQRLFLYTDGNLTKVYPVAVGRAMTQTNLGEHKIGAKAYNPVWHIPKSIQKERGDGVKTIAAGPDNPLGPVFVRLGDPKLGLGIHGTNAPASVPGVRSHGCVRMKSPDALEFAKTIATGSPASVIYQMASLNEDAGNNLWLAAFHDPYGKNNLDIASLKKSIAQWAKTQGKTIASGKIDAVLKARTGTPVCLTCGKNGKLKMPLRSLAWMQGSSAYSQPETPAQIIQSNPAEPSVPQTEEKQPAQSIRPVPILPSNRRPTVESIPQAETETLENTDSETVDLLF